MKPSSDHPNRRSHNWLVYSRHDRSLARHEHLLSGHVTDLGAGAASYKRWCLESECRYTSVDWSGSMHEGEIDVIANLNEPLPIRSESTDTILCFSVLEHLHDPENILHEASRILRPDGWLLLQVPWQWWIHEEPHDFFRYTPFALRRMLEKNGFDAINVEAQGGVFSTIALKINYFSLRFVKGSKFSRLILRALLWLPWQITQVLALLFDLIDLHPSLETPAFFVTARKSASIRTT